MSTVTLPSRRSRAWCARALFVASGGLASCSGSDPQRESRGDVRILVEPLEVNTLSARVVVESDRPVRASLRVTGAGAEQWDAPASAEPALRSELHALGMRPARPYTFHVSVRHVDGGVQVFEREFTAGDLPSDFPPVDVHVAEGDPLRLTAFSAVRVENRFARPGGVAYLVVVDGTGAVVWYAAVGGAPTAVYLDGRGTWWLVQPAHIERLTVTGRRLPGIHPTNGVLADVPADAVRIAADTFHHDVVELAEDRILTLATRSLWLGPRECPAYDATYNVVGDVAVELDLAQEAVVSEWSLFDAMDPCEAASTSFNDYFYGDLYGSSAADWTHANSVALDEAANAILVSVRHANQVVALRHRDDAGGPAGQVLWRLGEGGDFALAGAGARWFHYQHAARPLPGSRVMLYDNDAPPQGTPPDPSRVRNSRAVEYRIDADPAGGSVGRAEQIWEWAPERGRTAVGSDGRTVEVPFYAPILGGAIPTGDGTVLVTHGALLEPHDAPRITVARVIEVTHDAEARATLDVQIGRADDAKGWVVYRAVRPSSLYGGPGAY